MRYLNPCFRQTADGRYEQWERVVVRHTPLGVKKRFNPDDFAWVDVTEEAKAFLNDENKKKG